MVTDGYEVCTLVLYTKGPVLQFKQEHNETYISTKPITWLNERGEHALTACAWVNANTTMGL